MFVNPGGLIGGEDEAPPRFKVPEEPANIGIGDEANCFAGLARGRSGNEPNLLS